MGVKASVLKDDRQVTSYRTAYVYFYQSRYSSGDFKGMRASVAGGLAGREWKGLTDEEKKVRRREIPAGSVADAL